MDEIDISESAYRYVWFVAFAWKNSTGEFGFGNVELYSAVSSLTLGSSFVKWSEQLAASLPEIESVAILNFHQLRIERLKNGVWVRA